jgi:hypothetical protein
MKVSNLSTNNKQIFNLTLMVFKNFQYPITIVLNSTSVHSDSNALIKSTMTTGTSNLKIADIQLHESNGREKLVNFDAKKSYLICIMFRNKKRFQLTYYVEAFKLLCTYIFVNITFALILTNERMFAYDGSTEKSFATVARSNLKIAN